MSESPTLQRALIIDDEPPAREELKRLLAPHAHIAVVGEAGNVTAARRRLRKPHDYELVFLDVQLIGGSGFDLVADVAPTAKIIFATAHQQHALRALEVNALDFLLKPVTPNRLATSLQRAEQASLAGPIPNGQAAAAKPNDLLLIRTDEGSQFVDIATIAAIRSEQNYTRVAYADGSSQLIHRPLKSWEEELPPSTFLRVHRQWLVNSNHVSAVKTALLKNTHLQVEGLGEPVEVSRRRWAEVGSQLMRQSQAS